MRANVSGIYVIRNTANQSVHVGGCGNIRDRTRKHLSDVRDGWHPFMEPRYEALNGDFAAFTLNVTELCDWRDVGRGNVPGCSDPIVTGQSAPGTVA